MANDWLLDHEQGDGADWEEASSVGDVGAGEDIRYALTPLGAATLARDEAFVGFGPCAAWIGPSPEAEPSRRERSGPRARGARTTLLFG